jgi:hypothetical protein
MNLQSGLFSWRMGLHAALKPITKRMKPTIAQSITKYRYTFLNVLENL